MVNVQVNINTVEKVAAFCNVCRSFDFDVDIHSGRYVIDAKSIMGLFGLDISKPLTVSANVDKGTKEEKLFLSELKRFE